MSDTISPLTIGSGVSQSSSGGDAETFSLTESMSEYPYYHGRRYHSYREGSYLFPNDEVEQERMDWQFHIIKGAQGGHLFFAPIQEANVILDVGTGTGIWPIALADSGRFPNAKITGIDLSPIQPLNVPNNVCFELQDCSDTDWARPLDSIDLIYCQSLSGALTDYQQFLINARKYLNPGTGWIESCEVDIMPFSDDHSIPVDFSYKVWVEHISQASELIRKPLRIAHKLRRWMIDAGYVDVHEIISKVPIGSWPADHDLKMIGRQFHALILSSLSVVSTLIFEKAFGWTPEQTELACAQTRDGLKNKRVHAYLKIYTVYGRKPSEAEEKSIMLPPPLPYIR